MSNTPRFDAAYAECLDDAGKITRLEPLYAFAKATEHKATALERIVVELALIAISTANIKHHHRAHLDLLLGELQWAGVEMPKTPWPPACGDCDPCLGGRPDQCAVMAKGTP